MSYTPPSGSATNFQSGAPYTVPAGDGTNFSYEVGVKRSAGRRETRFGTASILVASTGTATTTFGIALAQMYAQPIGFMAGGTFGEPRYTLLTFPAPVAPTTTFGVAAITPTPTPIYSTVFGLPNSPYLQTCVPTGIGPALLGTHRLRSVHTAFVPSPSTVVSTAYTTAAQTALAAGETRTRFGAPIFRGAPSITENRTTFAIGWVSSAFGVPLVPGSGARTAYGFSSTSLGWPRGSKAGASAVFGTPAAGSTARPTGWLTGGAGTPKLTHAAVQLLPATTFGLPTTREAHIASPPARQSRLGTPASFAGGYKTYAIDLGRRFGRPTATNRINRTASGMRSTALGSPTSVERHRTTHTPPTTTFGGALLVRTPIC